MNDWLRLLTNAVKLANDFAEKQAECEYDAGYFLRHAYEELQEAKKDAIEALAEELQSHTVIKPENEVVLTEEEIAAILAMGGGPDSDVMVVDLEDLPEEE